MPRRALRMSARQFHCTVYISAVSQVLTFICALSIVCWTTSELVKYGEYYRVFKEPSRGLQLTMAFMFVSAMLGVLVPAFYLAVFSLYPRFSGKRRYELRRVAVKQGRDGGREREGGRGEARNNDRQRSVSRPVKTQSRMWRHNEADAAPSAAARPGRQVLSPSLSSSEAAPQTGDVRVDRREESEDRSGSGAVANPLDKCPSGARGDVDDGPVVEAEEFDSSQMPTPFTDNTFSPPPLASLVPASRVEANETEMAKRHSEDACKSAGAAADQLAVTVAQRGDEERSGAAAVAAGRHGCEGGDARSRSPRHNSTYKKQLVQLTLNGSVFRLLQAIYLALNVIALLLIFSMGLFGALATSFSTMTQLMTMAEGWDYVFYTSGTPAPENGTGGVNDGGAKHVPPQGPAKLYLSPDVNARVCRLQLHGKCSGGGALCNSTAYANESDAFSFFCPYCPHDQAKIATFTRLCTDRYYISDRYPVSYFGLSGSCVLFTLVDLVMATLMYTHGIVPAFSRSEHKVLHVVYADSDEARAARAKRSQRRGEDDGLTPSSRGGGADEEGDVFHSGQDGFADPLTNFADRARRTTPTRSTRGTSRTFSSTAGTRVTTSFSQPPTSPTRIRPHSARPDTATHPSLPPPQESCPQRVRDAVTSLTTPPQVPAMAVSIRADSQAAARERSSSVDGLRRRPADGAPHEQSAAADRTRGSFARRKSRRKQQKRARGKRERSPASGTDSLSRSPGSSCVGSNEVSGQQSERSTRTKLPSGSRKVIFGALDQTGHWPHSSGHLPGDGAEKAVGRRRGGDGRHDARSRECWSFPFSREASETPTATFTQSHSLTPSQPQMLAGRPVVANELSSSSTSPPSGTTESTATTCTAAAASRSGHSRLHERRASELASNSISSILSEMEQHGGS